MFLDCKWHKYKYSVHISEEDEHAVWRSVTPEPEKPKNKPKDDKPEKPPEPNPTEEPPPEAETPKKKYGEPLKRGVRNGSLRKSSDNWLFLPKFS